MKKPNSTYYSSFESAQISMLKYMKTNDLHLTPIHKLNRHSNIMFFGWKDVNSNFIWNIYKGDFEKWHGYKTYVKDNMCRSKDFSDTINNILKLSFNILYR